MYISTFHNFYPILTRPLAVYKMFFTTHRDYFGVTEFIQ